MEDGIVRFFLFCIILGIAVLILVVVDDGLVQTQQQLLLSLQISS